ncbi:hypothetical protein [Paracoccus aminophilus]|uniref:hypothetical protein n=1 Tax=Paracoccus aminophilus TaxID=34003 RepID=UPI0011DDC2D6|nr:hypothetical protein [Paracoccus aminophilus]
MDHAFLDAIDSFIAATGLSEHRVGIIVAGNGRLVPRLRNGGRVWPDTKWRILEKLRAERERRNLPPEDAA